MCTTIHIFWKILREQEMKGQIACSTETGQQQQY